MSNWVNNFDEVQEIYCAPEKSCMKRRTDLRTFRKVILALASPVFLSPMAFADPGPSYDDIFALKKSEGLIPCSEIQSDNIACDKPIVSTDASGKALAPRRVKEILLGGGENIGHAVVEATKKTSEKSCQFLIRFQDGKAASWVKAPCAAYETIEQALERMTATAEGSFLFNPELKTVSLSNSGAPTLPVKEVLNLKEDPNRPIGLLEIRPDLKDARETKPKKFLSFSFPEKGSSQWSSADLVKRLTEAGKETGKENMMIAFPVLRRKGNQYLVQIPQSLNNGIPENTPGFIADDVIVWKNYAWVEARGVDATFFAFTASTTAKNQPELASMVKFRMERGTDFQKAGATWTSFKVYALAIDFDSTKYEDENGNAGILPRKKTLVREIFLPVKNPEGHINFWVQWNPGC